jgi:hypothetical protein
MNEPIVFKYHDVPRFTYLLRRWFDDPADNTSTQAQVVVISEIEPLTRTQLLEKLQDLDVGEASEFLLVDMAPCASAVLLPIIERRRAMREPEHVFLLAAGRRPVTHRRLSDRFCKARAAAAKEHPACAALFLRDMRKRAGQLAGSLSEASTLLQHSSQSVTQRHYRSGDKLKPVR